MSKLILAYRESVVSVITYFGSLKYIMKHEDIEKGYNRKQLSIGKKMHSKLYYIENIKQMTSKSNSDINLC